MKFRKYIYEDTAEKYIKRIKNKKKKDYAQKYLKWLKSGKKGKNPDYGNLSFMAAQAVRMNLEEFINEAGFQGLPKGWTEESLKKWMNTFKKNHGVGPKDEGFFDTCVDAMSDELGGQENAKKFCAAVKDEAWDSTYWRGKGKSKKEVKKDVKKHKNV